jgi:hypothetical protein
MRWADFRPWEKVAIVVIGLWFTLGWFVALLFPNPIQAWALPFEVMLAAGALIWALLTVTAWVLRKLGH